MVEKSNVTKIEVFQGGTTDNPEESDHEAWYWHAKGGNGEIVANSAPESYTRLEDAVRAAEATFPDAKPGGSIPLEVTTVVNAEHHGSEATTEQDKSTAQDAQEEFQRLEQGE